ncbi:hypothetical protein [Nitrosopumilus sp.]
MSQLVLAEALKNSIPPGSKKRNWRVITRNISAINGFYKNKFDVIWE